MANEVVIKKDDNIIIDENGMEVFQPRKVKAENRIIKLSIKCMKKKGKNPTTHKEVEFNAIKGMKHIPSYKIADYLDDDGNPVYIFEGVKNRWLDVHFTMDAWKNTESTCNVHDSVDLTSGFLYVRAKYIDSPRQYRVKQDVNGELKYPQIWIKGGIVAFEPYVAEQDEFDYQPSDEVQDAEEVQSTLIEEPEEVEETTV